MQITDLRRSRPRFFQLAELGQSGSQLHIGDAVRGIGLDGLVSGATGFVVAAAKKMAHRLRIECCKSPWIEWPPTAKRVVFETGPLSVWLYHTLSAEGLPAICIDARHAKAALDMAPNKTDANDADGLAHLAEVGFSREVRVKGYDNMLIVSHMRLARITTEFSNQSRRLMKTSAWSFLEGKVAKVRRQCPAPACRSGRSLRVSSDRFLKLGAACAPVPPSLGGQLVASARQSKACQLLMSIPGVGAGTATSFTTAIEDPANFKKSRSVDARLGLTTRRYQPGQVDYDGHISRRGDSRF